MKSKFFLLGAASLLLAACTEELQLPDSLALVGNTTPLCINVLANPETKDIAGQVTGAALPANSSIGITLIKTGALDGKYDNNTYNNVEYHSNDGAAWGIVTGSVMLSATEGTVYGYYPYSVTASDVTAVPISATDSKDYMYANPKTGVKNANASVDLVMNHALSVVKFTINKASTNGYTGAGNISSVKLEGATLGSSGTMDITTGTVSATAGELTYSTALALNGTNTGELFAVPTGTESGIKFSVSMDGQTYTATTGNVTLAQGQRYTYTLNMSSTGLTVSSVTVTPWGDEQPIGGGSGDAELLDPWAIAKATDGVYAIDNDGNPVIYATANAAEAGTYKSVAFVVNGKAYQVAKVDARQQENTGQTELVYWQKDNLDNIAGLTDYTTADGSREIVALPFSNGSFHNEAPVKYQLNDSWTSWLSYNETAALSDFNGKENTTTIIDAQNGGATDFTIGKTVVEFRNNETYNEGKHDWHIPSAGELAFMFLKKDEINSLLSKVIGSEPIKEDDVAVYWSSSEYGSNNAWFVLFSSGGVMNNVKHDISRLRLVRAI